MPLICAGDFNDITRAHEKLEGRLRPFRQMQDFRDVLMNVALKTWGTWEENIHGATNKGMDTQFGRGLIGLWQQLTR